MFLIIQVPDIPFEIKMYTEKISLSGENFLYLHNI